MVCKINAGGIGGARALGEAAQNRRLKTMFFRQIDAGIDSAEYELYGLTEEEIKVVEGGG